ncbi:E3 ubiquitin-protein ligase TRIM11-like [Hyperolius riggenbachi]|uniref:E3 ubiquitin-protein ligase TRIM11-like n=1 Tax=Hyperolius riggenbachi TaxID=752182 RepID=UPI0035A2D83D
MASADVRRELHCSICLDLYTDPVNLPCGHNFCHRCICHVLKVQALSGNYSCPECREKFESRPVLQRNVTLRKILAAFQAEKPTGQSSWEFFCTYCTDSPVAAVKACLLCKSLLCDEHLGIHSKSPEHVLAEPSTSLENRQCSMHQEAYKYYCFDDAVYTCESCVSVGDHQGHKVETLEYISDQTKQELRHYLDLLICKRKKVKKSNRVVQEHARVQRKRAIEEKRQVSALLNDLKKQLDSVEKQVLGDISRQETRMEFSASYLSGKLESKSKQLADKMEHVEDLCNLTDPLTVLTKVKLVDLSDLDEEEDEVRPEECTLDVTMVPHALRAALSDIIKGVTVCFDKRDAADLSLDVGTASNFVHVSDDLKTATRLDKKLERPDTQERYPACQVLSTQSFSSGRHYWEIDVGKSNHFLVGACYPSIEKRGFKSLIGKSNKSWFLLKDSNRCVMLSVQKHFQLQDNISSHRLRLYLDYEAGQLSFYQLCDPVRHLCTFTATFTEPLHAAFCVLDGSVELSGNELRE